jgi:hypothetical protein
MKTGKTVDVVDDIETKRRSPPPLEFPSVMEWLELLRFLKLSQGDTTFNLVLIALLAAVEPFRKSVDQRCA